VHPVVKNLRTYRRRRVPVVAAITALAISLCACSGGSGSEADDGPVTITFWSWLPGVEEEVALFEAAHPDINVNLVNAGALTDEYTKLDTALKAGSGAPDAVHITFDYLPTYQFSDSLLDLAPYGADEFEADFEEWVWAQVSDGDAVYAIPQDTGPMGLLYRTDIFEKTGVEVPTTWEEFADAAEAMHAADSDPYITNLAPNDPGHLWGLMWQAGARPFEVDGDHVSIDIASPEAMRWADYWTDLIQRDVVSTDPDYTTQWYGGFANDRYASWLTAAWGPVFLSGQVEKTQGLWRVAHLPQWEEGSSLTSANWGGSTTAVMKQTEHPEAAAEFAIWLNTNAESTDMMVDKQFLFPALKNILASTAFQDQKDPFYKDQETNKLFIEASESISKDFQWSPFQTYVSSQLTTILSKAIEEHSDLGAALEELQENVVSYAEAQGFTVTAP
jgi:multiple sugar transport system substrate-binding protein